jgi:hypothetical protein
MLAVQTMDLSRARHGPSGGAAGRRTGDHQRVDWDGFDLEPLAEELRRSCGPADAERMVYAFERVVGLARLDPELLSHLLAATACLLASIDGVSPRSVLETYFRRAVSDEQWQRLYLPLFQ